MALRLKFRSFSISQLRRCLSTTTTETTTSPLSGKEKSRATLDLLITENNPDRILQICRAANLVPTFHLDRLAFSKAIFKLRDFGCSDQVRELLAESMTRPDIKSERSAAPFIALYGQAGLQKDALKVFEKMPEMGFERTVKSLNALLTAYFSARDYDEMKRVYAEFPKIYGIVPNRGTYATMMKGLCVSGDSSSAFSILCDMESKGVKPNGTMFNTIMAGLYKDEKLDDVGRVLEAMKEHNITPDVTTCNVRIQGLCKLKRSKEAMALLLELELEGIEPDVTTYTYLIHGFGREGNFEEAKRLFERMVDLGIKPDWQAYSTIVYFLCQGRDFLAAAIYCKDWIVGERRPPFALLKSLVEGLAGISMADEAKEITGMLKEKFPANSDMWTELEDLLASNLVEPNLEV